MLENTVADCGLARSPPVSGGKSQEHLSLRESDNDTNIMRSILAAAIGLTSLGAPASPARPPKENVVAPPKSAVVPQRTEPARKKPKTTTAPDRRKPATAVMAAAVMTRPAPPPAYHDQLPMFTLQNDCSATGALLLPSRGIKMTQSQHPPPSYFATTVVHRPTPHPHLFPEYLNPPPPTSFTSQLRLNIHPDDLGLPPKRQKVNQRSRSTPLEQLPAHQSRQPTLQTHYPTQPATNGTAAVEPSPASLSLNFPETLYEILSSPSNQHILSWLPHGHGFVIHDRQLFASQILPQHFDGAKFTSFTRRLKRWKFERVPRGPEMGAYYNKYFVRDRPDLVQGMMYGMEDDEQLMKGDGEHGVTQGPQTAGENDKKKNKTKEEKKKKNMQDKQSEMASLDADADHDDAVMAAAMELHRQQQWQQRQLKHVMGKEMVMDNTEGQGGQSENMKKEKKQKNKPDTVASVSAAYDDAVVEAAMKVHRQQQLQWQQQQLCKESENCYQEKNLDNSYQETAWRQQQQQKQALVSSRQDSSIPEKLLAPYNPSDYILPGMSNMTWLNDTQVHQQQQSKLLQPLSSMESAGPKPKQPQYQNPHNGIWHTSQPGYEELPKPRQKRKQQKQRMQPQQQQPCSSLNTILNTSQPRHPKPTKMKRMQPQQQLKPCSRLNNPEELEMHHLPTPYNPEAYKPEDYLSMSMARRNILATSSLINNRSMVTHQSNSIPGTMTSHDRDEFRMPMVTRHRNNSISGTMVSLDRNAFLSKHLDIISPPDTKQQQCLNVVEQQILSEISYPMLPTTFSSSSLSTNCSLRRDSNNRMNDRMNYNSGMSDRTNDNSGKMNAMMSVTMADRDNMARDTTSPFLKTHLQLNNHRFLANQGMIQKVLVSSKSHDEIIMMAARNLQSGKSRANNVVGFTRQPQLQQPQLSPDHLLAQQQPLPPPRHRSMQAPLSLSRMQQKLPQQLQAPLSPSRTRYLVSRAMMLHELEEKLETEILATEAEAATARLREGFEE